MGVFLKGLEALWVRTGDVKYYEYLKAVIDSFLAADGSIHTYRLEEYNLDNINCGKLLLTLFQKTGRREIPDGGATADEAAREHQPRTKRGGILAQADLSLPDVAGRDLYGFAVHGPIFADVRPAVRFRRGGPTDSLD